MNKKIHYAQIINDGNDIEYKDLSLCDLRRHVPWYRNKKVGYYQVHSNKFSQIYSSLSEAIDKYLELKGE